ncbi:MAG: nuclear transport factor 2 family protein [Novosphingobium sp.]|nr:nuclear transport factor 2 family protein [Novosphingobium sp.]
MDEARLQEMWDHHEIRQLLATYCHGCDRGDEVEMASTYAADSRDDHGPRKMEGRRFSIETVEEALRTTNLVSHQLGQSLITVHGDSAGADTYFIATLLYPGKDGGETIGQLGGRYVDTLVRENGKWLIKDRICVREWSHSHPVTGDWLAEAGFAGMQRGQADPSYAALGLTHSGNPWLSEVEAPA